MQQLATSPTGSDYRHEGKFCSVWPYLRGHFERDFLYKLWCIIEAEQDWKSLLWEMPPSDTPIDQRGDLIEWIHYMESILDPKSLLMVQDNQSKEIAGLIWFNRQKPDSAHGAIWMSKKYRGGYTREAVKLGLEYAFYARGWQTIYAITPWAVARNLLRKCGWTQLAKVPELYGRDVYMMAIKEQNYG